MSSVPPPSTTNLRGLVAATIATVMVVSPPFLLGGMSVLLRAELQFDEAALGLTAGAFFLSTAVLSLPGGRLAERIGARRGIFLGAGTSGLSLLMIALTARSWALLTAWMFVAGFGNAVGQPAANLSIARTVSDRRQGIAFGIKQSAIPMAGLAAGIALPLIGLTVGWRWAFAIAPLGTVLVVFLAPRDAASDTRVGTRRTRTGDAPIAPLIVLSLGVMLGTMAAQTLGTFLVESIVAAGISPSRAGLLLALGSFSGIAMRLVSGWMADRRSGRHLVVIAGMLTGGAVGFAMLAFGAVHISFVIVGIVLAFGLGWGWHGLYFMAIVRLNPSAPALATGITQSGGAAGAVLGPFLFGLIVSRSTYPVAWGFSAGVALLGALFMLIGRRHMMARRATPPATGTVQPEA